MTTTVKLFHDYPCSAERVWRVATDLDHLREVTQGLLAFRGLPGGQIFAGQQLNVEVSLFGALPFQPYAMTVEQCDPDEMSFQSSETGAGVKVWRHSLTVTAQGDGARIDEQIEIDAGKLTPLFAAWARFMYRRRHAPRLRILGAEEAPSNNAPTERATTVLTKGKVMNSSDITGFHAHVYFDETTMEAAKALCETAAERFGVDLGHMHTRPIGPHPAPSCQLDCTTEQFGMLLPWLLSNRGELTVFCHASSGDHLADHTRNTFWLGEPYALNLSIFK